MQPLTQDFFKQDTVQIAKSLIGTYLIHELLEGKRVGKIVETEAYIHNDPANHAFKGVTKRNKIIFGPPGRWYIYFIYGRYYCLNVTTGNVGQGEAVLIRAIEPIEGLAAMRLARRKTDNHELGNGPARLVQAMGIPKEVLGKLVFRPPVYLSQDDKAKELGITTTTRIGIRQNESALLRFFETGSSYISHL